METFVDKVRYGGGSKFNPMLEEKGGWIVGEAPKQEEEIMVDVLIGVMAKASQGTPKVERNVSSFLVRKEAMIFKIDFQKLLTHIALLKEQLLITKFVGLKPNSQAFEIWLQTMNHELKINALYFCRNVGKGYFFLNNTESGMVHKALMLFLVKTKWGTCMLQSWVPRFNPYNPNNLAFSMSVRLRNLPHVHHDQAHDIVKSLGEVIGIYCLNMATRDPMFCFNLNARGQGDDYCS